MATFFPIIYNCNLKCVFCSAENYKKTKRFSPPFADLARSKGGYVQISGGEPLLFPDKKFLLLAVAGLKKQGKFVEFQTNGVLIKKEKEFIGRIIPFVDLFNVNFSAHNSAVDLKVCGVAGVFKPREEGVKFLLNAKAPVRLTYVVNKKNFKYCENFAKYVSEKFPGIKMIQFSFVKAVGAAQGAKKIVPVYEETAPYLKKAFKFCEKSGVPFAVDHIPLCFLRGFEKRNVDYLKLAAGQKGVFLKEKGYVKKCGNCEMLSFCSGPRKDYVKIYGKI